MNISVSLLSSYLYCPRKIYLERVLGFYEPPKEALVLGTIKHETYEEINKIEESLVKKILKKLPLEELEALYKDQYAKLLRLTILRNKEKMKDFNLEPSEVFKRSFPIIAYESKRRALNLHNFIEKHNLFGIELWEHLTPKIQSEVKIKSATLELSGIIDQLEVYEEGFGPVELKSGSAPKEGVWPNHKIQIAAYAMLLEEHHKTSIKEGFIHYIDINQKRHIPINLFLKEEIKDLKNKVKLMLNSPDLPPFCENKNKCNACGLKVTCFDEKTVKKRQKELLK